MAIRVRKLAKELGVQPDQVLAVLGELGYDRYRTPQDMVPDPAIEKLRSHVSALRRRGERLPSAAVPPSKATSAAVSPGRPASAAVPSGRSGAPPAPPGVGPVVEQRDVLADALDRPIDEIASVPLVDDRVRATIAEASEAVRAEQAALHAQARRLRERAAALEEQADALRAERDALQAERRELQDELVTAREEIASRTADLDAIEAGGVPVARLLDERGLRGPDEHARALAALAVARMLDPIVPRLRVVDAGPVRRLLAERLVLGEAPFDGLEGVAVVQVARERAELPAPESLRALRDRLWEECLLCGLKRVRVLGGRALDHRLLGAAVDPRLQLSVLPVAYRDGDAASSDIAEVDLLVLRDVELAPTVAELYAASSLVVVDSHGPGVAGLIHDVLRALSAL